MIEVEKSEHAEALLLLTRALLAQFNHPTLSKNLTELGAIQQVVRLDNQLYVDLLMPFAWNSGFECLQREMSPPLCQLTGAEKVNWRLTYQIATLRRSGKQQGCTGVKNIIAISSGKGGVGKSSTATNLALALAAEGGKVGILDADIYGPSIPAMLGCQHARPTSPDGKHMAPIMAHGLATNSIGYLMSDDNATIWRGPMASKALLQLLNETLWPDLDYLIVDLPPGTGDIQLTLAQNIPVTAAIVITTPQDIALYDARKGIIMFEKVQVPVAGVIENMSMHICQRCGHQEAIFGQDGAKKLAEDFTLPLLAQIPLNISVRQDLDAGRPTVVNAPNSELSGTYKRVAAGLAAQLYWQCQVIPDDISIRMI